MQRSPISIDLRETAPPQLRRRLSGLPLKPHASSLKPRSGFTLVELIVVILIMAILAAILLPAIGNVRTTARNAQVTVDIKNLEKAIADFKLKYQMEPPSSFILRENGAYDTNSMSNPNYYQLEKNSLVVMRQLWPDYDPTNGTIVDISTSSKDLNGNGSVDTSPIVMNGAECLVFFLGGSGMVTTPGNSSPGSMPTVAPVGFSTNPAYPFVVGGSRVGPFYEFDSARLVDTDATPDGVPELVDPLPNQTAPYQYLSSYSGRGYQLYGYNASTSNGDEEITPGCTLASAYFKSVSGGNRVYWNSKSYQIISPGFDANYGLGGCYRERVFYDNTNGTATRVATEERDNNTNFSGGPLVP